MNWTKLYANALKEIADRLEVYAYDMSYTPMTGKQTEEKHLDIKRYRKWRNIERYAIQRLQMAAIREDARRASIRSSVKDLQKRLNRLY